MAKDAHEILADEVRRVFDAQNEPMDSTTGKKLIINACVSGGFVNRTHNPNIPSTAEGVAKHVRDARNAGAAMWHFHPRDPETDMIYLAIPQRVKLHKEWCDAVFALAPDIITDVGAIYCAPPVVNGGVIEEKSILAENRMAPLVEQLVALGRRYIEIGISLNHVAALGRGSNLLSFNNRVGVISDVKYLESKGIRIEFSPFKHSDILDVKEWIVDPGIAKKPFILDTLLGLHNSPCPRSMTEAIDLLLTYHRMFPKQDGIFWHMLTGGRYWMPMAAMAIMLGADIVRIGFEDAVHMYPHSNTLIRSCGEVVEAVAGIARALGREVATPSEAREMLGLPQLKS